MARQTIILHSESEFVTTTNRSRFKHITSLKRNYKLHQRALTLSYDEETTLLINNLSKISFNMMPYFQTTVINKHINDKMSPHMAANMNSEKVLKLSKFEELSL